MLRSSRVALASLVLGTGLLAAGCQSALELKVGDCFDGGDGETVSSVTPKPCTEAHAREVFAVPSFAADGTAYPGEAALASFAETECVSSFQAYVGRDYSSSELLIAYLTPSPDSWDGGDRVVACLLYLENQQMSGPMRGSGR